MDFFALNEEGKTDLIRSALEQGRSFRLSGTGPDGAQGTITCESSTRVIAAAMIAARRSQMVRKAGREAATSTNAGTQASAGQFASTGLRVAL